MASGVKRRSATAAPDGGWGWMIVAGCFITTICTRAVTRCVSIFFLEFHMHFFSDYSRTAWIHSLVDCTTMLCAPLGSYIGNRFSCRVAVMVGGLLSSLGLILSSFASSLEYLYLSLGILTGLGFALCYTPAVAMVGSYFSERKALAYGIAMSGSGIGTFVLAPVVQLLIELYSWRGALLILGGFASHLVVCGALMRPLNSHSQKQDGEDREEKHSMLNAKLAEANLHMELNIKEDLEMAKLDFGGVNIDIVINGGLEEEITQNEEQDLDSTLEEDLVETDTQMMEKTKDIESNPGDTKVIFMNTTSKDLKLNTNSKSTNLKDPPASEQMDLQLLETMLMHSALNDSMRADSELTDSMLAGLELNDSKLPKTMLTDSVLNDSKESDSESVLHCSKLPETMLTDSALNDSLQVYSELIDSIQADTELIDSMQSGLRLSDSKLPETILIDSTLNDSIQVYLELTDSGRTSSKVNDSKLPESMLIDSTLNYSMQVYLELTDSGQAGLKLNDSKLPEKMFDSTLNDSVQVYLELTDSGGAGLDLNDSKQSETMLIDSALNDSIQVYSELIDSGRAGSELNDSKVPETMLIDLMQADSELMDLKLHKSMLVPSVQNNSMQADSELTGLKRPETMQVYSAQTDPMRDDSELNDSKLSASKLVYSGLNESMPTQSVLAESKLIDSKLLYEVASCEHPGFPVKNEAPGESREKQGCFFLPSTEEYSFLLIPDFLLLSVSFLFLAFGCSVPFVYLVPYSLSIGVGHQQAALLMSLLGVMGIVGNITFGWISDRRCLRAYRIVSYLLAVGLEGMGCLFVPLLWNFSLLVPFCLFYGYFDGAYVALLPVVTSDTVGPTYLSSALGVVCFLHAIPYLISPPIAGWLVDQTGSYTAAFLLCGFSLICSALILATVKLSRRCSRGSSHSY